MQLKLQFAGGNIVKAYKSSICRSWPNVLVCYTEWRHEGFASQRNFENRAIRIFLTSQTENHDEIIDCSPRWAELWYISPEYLIPRLELFQGNSNQPKSTNFIWRKVVCRLLLFLLLSIKSFISNFASSLHLPCIPSSEYIHTIVQCVRQRICHCVC